MPLYNMLPLLLFSFLPLTTADPTDGFSQVSLNNSDFQVQYPYDLNNESERYSFDGTVRKFWVYDDDKPFRQDSPTKPRTEIRILGHDYSSGVWQFEGQVYIPTGTTGTSVMQIHRADRYRRTAMMLRVYHGRLCNYMTDIGEGNAYDRWMRVNVIHDVDADNITIYIDGVQKVQVGGRGPGTCDFKFGVYTQDNPSHYMESRWKGVRILQK